MKELTQSKYFKVTVAIVGMLIIALVSFAGGVAVGLHKAKFSYAWGENYERNFVGGARGMMSSGRGGMMDRFGFDDRDFRNANGISGRVLSVSGNTIIISDRNNRESTVTVTDKTIFKKSGADIGVNDITKDDTIVVIGNPSEGGVVNADFIRVFGQEKSNQ